MVEVERSIHKLRSADYIQNERFDKYNKFKNSKRFLNTKLDLDSHLKVLKKKLS